MVLENIYPPPRGAAKIRMQAAILGAREITFAAMAATAAIVAIFLPVAFMKGIIGRFFFEFGVTISVAVLLSLLEALTLDADALLAVPGGRRARRPVRRRPGSILRQPGARLQGLAAPALRHRWIVLTTATAIFAASLFIALFINREFVPSQDRESCVHPAAERGRIFGRLHGRASSGRSRSS